MENANLAKTPGLKPPVMLLVSITKTSAENRDQSIQIMLPPDVVENLEVHVDDR